MYIKSVCQNTAIFPKQKMPGNSEFKMWLSNEYLDTNLQSAGNPEQFKMRQRNKKEKKSSFMVLVDWFKIISNLKEITENQNSKLVDGLSPFTLEVPEAIQMTKSASIYSLHEFWKEYFEISNSTIENKNLIKPKRLWDRSDIIQKSILRSFKKYYLNELNDLTDFKRKLKIVNCQDIFLDLANDFIRQKISENPYKDLNIFIVALTRPNLEETLKVEPKLAELSSLVKNVLYGFNKSKISDLLSYPQFSFILKKFLSFPNIIEFIREKYSHQYTKESLSSQISFLIEKWDEILTKSEPDSVCDWMRNPQVDF